MKTIVFDAHCDTPVELWRKGARLAENAGQVSLARAARLDGYVQFFAFCTPWLTDGRSCRERYLAAYDYFQTELRRTQERVRQCHAAEDAEAALEAGQTGVFLSIEGAEALDCAPGLLASAHAQGVRMINPVWNHENALAGSCVTGGGFTKKGLDFCREAERLGILLDVSHLSDRGFWQLCERAEKPFLASHSNARAVCAHPRNLTDEQFRALCACGGAVGVNLYADFLREDGPATLEDVYRHIDHFLELGGDGHLCLGGDLDGCERLPEGFGGVDDYGKLQDYLRARGYTDAVLENLFYKSLMKVVKLCTM